MVHHRSQQSVKKRLLRTKNYRRREKITRDSAAAAAAATSEFPLSFVFVLKGDQGTVLFQKESGDATSSPKDNWGRICSNGNLGDALFPFFFLYMFFFFFSIYVFSFFAF